MVDLDKIINEPGFEGLFIGPHVPTQGVFISLMNRTRRKDRQVRAATLSEALSELLPPALNLEDL
jgi:hypothetical protein